MAGISTIQSSPDFRAIHLADVQSRPAVFRSWERTRHRRARWLVECLSEMLGVFCYCYTGVGAQAAFIVGNILTLDGVGSLLTVGFANALGVVVALVVFGTASGSHFSPAVTLVHIIFNGFPIVKGLRYIAAQIFGAFAACCFVYWQWKTLIGDAEAVLIAAGQYDAVIFSSSGPAGVFALYSNPADPVGLVFLNEFVTDFIIGLVISACLDPTNFFAPIAAIPWIIGMTYATAVWGFAPNGLVGNTARDLGGRLVAIAIWGTKANGGSYAAIAALTNILATVLAYTFYEFVLKDSSRVLPADKKDFVDSRIAEVEYRESHIKKNLL